MNTPRAKKTALAVDYSSITTSQTGPTVGGYGHPDQLVQAIMEMQKSLGHINASITSLTKSVDTTKAKVESFGDVNASFTFLTKSVDNLRTKVDDLVKWKNVIFGGVLVGGALISSFAYLITKASDYVTVKAPSVQIIRTPSVLSPQVASLKGFIPSAKSGR
jgi:hypothetical protein